MNLAIILLILILIAITLAILTYTKNKKQFVTLLICALAVFTIIPIVKKPALHKPFSISIIDYIVKFNTDGSITTTKQTTSTVMKEDNQ